MLFIRCLWERRPNGYVKYDIMKVDRKSPLNLKGTTMDRRFFIAAAALGTAGAATSIAKDTTQDKTEEKKIERAPGHGVCGLSCAACRMKLNGTCKGCGKGPKAECAIFKCAKEKELAYCAQCKGYPCPKIKKSGKFGDAWLEKTGKAPVPTS